MLSKKMTVSLMSLITIFALAFAVTPAMAEFAVKMTIHPDDDISTADGAQADPLKPVRVRVTFDKIVVKGATTGFDKSDVMVFAQDKYGSPVKTQPAISAVSDYTPADGLNYMFTVPVPAADSSETAKVVLYMEKHAVELADPRAEIGDDGMRKDAGKSAAAALEIFYLHEFDHGAPRVYEIRRASPHERPPVLKETADSFQVVVTLSEEPKKFTKDHINVTNATAAEPIALIPIPSTGNLGDFGEGLTGAPQALSLYSDATATPATVGLHEYLNVTGADDAAINTALTALAGYADLSSELQDAIKAYIKAVAAYNAQRGTTSYFPELGTTANLQTAMADDTAAIMGLLPRTLPDKKLTIGTQTGEINLTTMVTADGKIDVSGAPTIPSPGDYGDKAAYDAAVADYRLLNDAYMEYTKAAATKTAYEAAVEQVSKDHEAAIQEYLEENIGDASLIGALQTSRPSTGTDGKLHRYYVVITPKFANKNDVVVKIKEFEDLASPAMKYIPPTTDRAYTEGFDKLTVQINREDLPVKTAGIDVYVGEDIIIPKDGYLVIAKKKAGSAVRDPGDAKKSPVNTARKPFGLTYNLVEGGDLPNLERLLLNGGTIDVVGPSKLVISEIMWGSDASIENSFESQYIELYNVSGAEIKAAKETYKLVLYTAGQTLPAMSVAANNIQDRVGTVGAHGHWSVIGKGQSGRTGVGEAPGDVVAITPTLELVSMQRAADATSTTGLAMDGTDPDSWGASVAPGTNFAPNVEGERVGSPGREPHTYPTAPTPTPPPPPTAPAAKAADIVITEIMVDTSNGRLPQWIELTNVSGAEVSLADWSVQITNPSDDDEVIGASVTIDLTGTLGIGGGTDAGGTLGKSLLLVAGAARSSANLAGNDRVVDVSSQLDQRGRYTLISMTAFMIALIPPQETGVLKYGDMAGNLGAAEAWDIPMSETGRSSLIRRQLLDDGMATMGTDANGWVLASSTSLVSGPTTWYGSDEDAGTPGYDAGGPLPVELSHFRPARDKATGAVVITWSTQSELNNAGFFIKRSNQRKGQFEVVNATMIPGAGTTSEKQFYTYTDTTAQPNVVYYYQIEDVSLDGNRQTLDSWHPPQRAYRSRR